MRNIMKREMIQFSKRLKAQIQAFQLNKKPTSPNAFYMSFNTTSLW